METALATTVHRPSPNKLQLLMGMELAYFAN